MIRNLQIFSAVALTGLLGATACSTDDNNTTSSSSNDGNSGGGGKSGTSSSGTGGIGGSGVGTPRADFIVFPSMGSTRLAPQLFRIDPEGNGLKQLTTSTSGKLPTGANDSPALAPDRKTILFASGRDFQSTTEAPDPTLRMLYLMDADGSKVHKVTKNSPLACSEHPGGFSNDGAWIVFSMRCDQSVDPDTTNQDKLYRVHPDGSGQEKLAPNDPIVHSATNQVKPVFTPSGTTIVFLSDVSDGNSDVFTLDLKAQKVNRLSRAAETGRSATEAPMVAPSGDLVYFVTLVPMASQSAKVEKIKLDGTGNEVLWTIEGDPMAGYHDTGFALSPKGDQFVFSTLLDGHTMPVTHQLVISGLDGRNRATINSPSFGYQSGAPSWR